MEDSPKQGHPLIMGIGVGGGIKLYQGIAGPPDTETFKRYGIDFVPYVDEAGKDTWVNDVPDEIYSSTKIIGHPSGTAPIGKLVDSNLETQIKNLYCCDTSVIPEALGRPPTWTVVALAKRLVERLETIV